MLKVVTLDLDGVYFLDGHQNFKKNMQAVFGLSQDQIRDVYFIGDFMQQYKKGEINDQQFWSWAIQAWQINTDQQKILDILVSGYQVSHSIKELISQLRQQSIKIAACTNNFPARIYYLDKKFDFLRDFDIKIFSFEQGHLKPSREIFQALIKDSSVRPNEILITDDSPEKLGPAKDLGINVLAYTYFGKLLEDLITLGIKLDLDRFNNLLTEKKYSQGGVVLNQKKQVLLVYNTDGNWVLPKGKIKPNESSLDAARREVQEESSLQDFELVKKLPGFIIRPVYEYGILKHEEYYLFKTDYTGILNPQEARHTKAGWFDFGQAVNNLTYRQQKKFLLDNKDLILNI